MRKPTNLKKEIKEKREEKAKMIEIYNQKHHEQLVVSVLKLMRDANIIKDDGSAVMEKEQIALFLATITEDITNNIKDGSGKKDFVTAVLSIAEHYGVLDFFDDEEELLVEETEELEK
jgi:benzoyl-CoA reductase/2-hydroxyglutaryl-CoA dehydratase subunit BcrC/BadD/HgdB